MATTTKKKPTTTPRQPPPEGAPKTTNDAITTAKTTVETVQRDLTDAAGDVQDAVSNVFLAGLGALAVAEEEGSKTFKKLVKKGEKVELPGLGMDRVKAIRDQIERRGRRGAGRRQGPRQRRQVRRRRAADKVEDRVQETVKTVMKRLGVPTREEISELTASVERLTKNIETLKTSAPHSSELTLEAVGGGWYEIQIGDVVVEKIQGKEEAEKSLIRVQEQRA